MNLKTEAHKFPSKMKARGGRSSWSFKFLAKRQSRLESTSTFYCHDFYEAPTESPITVGVDSDSPIDLPSKEKVRPSDVLDISFSSDSNKHDPEDTDELVSFCCGLRKIPSKSTSFSWSSSSRVCLPEVAHRRDDVDLSCKVVNNQCESFQQNRDFADARNGCSLAGEMTLVPCKRDTLYPQMPSEDCSQIIGPTEEWETEFPATSPGGEDMSTVLERRKLFEVADRKERSSKPTSVLHPLRHLNKQNFRNSFTTEDADLFMKKSNLGKQKVTQNVPSVVLPKTPFTRDQSPKNSKVVPVRQSNSHSMRELSNAGLSGDEGKAPKTRSTPKNTPNGPQKPLVPPKPKVISFAICHKELEMSGDCTRVNKNSLSDSLSSDGDSFEDSDVDDSTCFSGVGQGDHPHLDFGSKAQKVANELLETEKVYVKKLFLIDQIFHMEVIRRNRLERFVPDEVIPQIFSNIKCIYQFHNDYLLPELTNCMESWEQEPKVGPVMKKAAPFFKLYTEFVTNFSNASGLISSWILKSEKFAQVLEEIQKHPECGNLTLQHHLLEPIQRVPRYQLLLAEYLRRLPEDSQDREPVEVALKLVSEAAQHTNDEMKKMEKFKKLLDTCANLVHSKNENLVSINRELIKEGKMTKISARDGSLLDRYLFLFNDVLLVCMCLPLKIGFGQQYLVKSKLDICGMKVYEGDNEEHPNSFVIMSKQKSIEFTASSADEKTEWVTEIWSVIKLFVDKERTKDKEFLKKTYVREEELGKRAPTWVKDQDTSMCMLCSVTFKTFKRRHHCRACGKVVCNECSTHKLRMDFDMENLNRVCDICYGILESSSSPTTTKIAQRHKGPKVLGVKATSEQNVMCGNLNLSLDNKTWQKRWLVLHSNCALYIFKAKRDNAATDSLPLPGYNVDECKSDDNSKSNVFKIFHEKLPKVYFFSTEDKSLYSKWLESLRLAIRAELPSTPHVGSTPSNSVATPALLPANELSLIQEINKELESSTNN